MIPEMLMAATEVIAYSTIFCLTATALAGTVMLTCYGLYILGVALFQEKRK
jgi:hypothetical protein